MRKRSLVTYFGSSALAVCTVALFFTAPAAAQIDPPDLWQPVRLPALTALQHGAAAWGDYDGDGDLDLFFTGNEGTFDAPQPFTQFYFNQGDYVIEIPDPSGNDGTVSVPATDYAGGLNVNLPVLEDIWRGAVAWGDFNNDGRLDVVSTGLTGSGNPEITIYENANIEERFIQRFSYPGLNDGDISWGDYDNDGDLDFAVAGMDVSGVPQTWIFENDVRNDGQFTRQDAGLTGLRTSSLAWGDYDNDMDLDLVIAGVADPQRFETILYQNDGNGNFQEVSTDFAKLYGSSVAWGDGDADGDLDLLLSGAELNPFLLEGTVIVYENAGGNFTTSNFRLLGAFEGDPALGRYAGDAAWGDFNNDGVLDFIVNGIRRPLDTDGGQTYESRGNQTYLKSTIGFRAGIFDGATNGPSFWGDYDNDGDLDLFVMGRSADGLSDVVITMQNYLPFYPNNFRPNPPGFLSSSVNGNNVVMSWARGNDGGSPADGLTYNLRVGSTSGGIDVVAPMSTVSTGRRLVPEMGNVQHNLSWTIKNLPSGTYYWSVQSVDTSFRGSQFAVEETFTIQ